VGSTVYQKGDSWPHLMERLTYIFNRKKIDHKKSRFSGATSAGEFAGNWFLRE
jgi:hypothetical protein